MTLQRTRKPTPLPKQTMENVQEAAKSWWHRHVVKSSRQQDEGNEDADKKKTIRRTSMTRPRTAPANGTTTTSFMEFPKDLHMQEPPPGLYPPTSAGYARPSSGVVRHVNAWLDASVEKPASPTPLMGGLQYWHEAPGDSLARTTGTQYAIRIGRDTEWENALTPRSQPVKTICHRARRVQVRMPSLLQLRTQHDPAQKLVRRRSTSMPMLSLAYQTHDMPAIGTSRHVRVASFTHSAPEAAIPSGPFQTRHWPSSEDARQCRQDKRRPNERFSELECNMVQSINAMFGAGSRTEDGGRARAATSHVPRENSTGNLSDAPSYFSGPPPPSYRSRTDSILTTSSFGCIDGMNPEQRQISQKRAAASRTMKGKMKKFAQKALSP